MGTLRIISHSDQPFSSRAEAGELLGNELKNLHGQGAVVIGIPRGGIIVANEIARALEADLDIILSRKLGAPGNPELAMGAVAEDGELFLDEMILSQLGIENTYIEQEKALQWAEITRRARHYRKIRPKVSLKERLVIVTDDGVATGATLQAALWAARQEYPKKLIVALPVGPEHTVKKLAKSTDEMICLRIPSYFQALSQFYMQFNQIEDEDVLSILKEVYERRNEK